MIVEPSHTQDALLSHAYVYSEFQTVTQLSRNILPVYYFDHDVIVITVKPI